jgi:hypothetical protein|tara:strand:- start:505 stop:1155 length:651 start_codon:yes stop_codon:yes gene_type:complete
MKVEVYIPDTLSEITLGQYQKYLKIQENNEDENFLAIKMIEIFCGLRGDTIMAMKANSIKDITLILTEMFNEKPQLVKEFKMGGRNYGFVPKLEDMTFGEYIDLDTYIGDMNNIHRAMNVLYRPMKQKYQDRYLVEDYTGEDPEKMLNMPMDAVLSSILFFYNLGMDLSKAMLNSLEKDQETSLAQYLTSEESGDGINHFSVSLKEILEDLKISLN